MTVTVQAIDRRAPFGEREFLPAVIKGLAVTMRHFFRNLLARRDIVTIQYPEQRTPYPERFRGLHRLMLRPDGELRCVACMLCPTVCPAHCITVVAKDTGDLVEKRAALFEIDELRCVVCGLCVEACPADAIRMDTGIHAPPVRLRGEAVYDAPMLASRGGLSIAVQGGEEGDWRKGQRIEE